MKLRIKGSSLRLRVSRSEGTRLIQTGRLEETVRFAREDRAKLTHALELSVRNMEISLRYRPQEVTVTLPTLEARRWFESDQVGLYRNADVEHEVLAVTVEKDFACLNGPDADSEDACENPNRGSLAERVHSQAVQVAELGQEAYSTR